MKQTVEIARTLSNGVEIPVEDNYIWSAYGDKCVMCVYQLAVCLHESPPKSKNPNWIEEPWTRFPLCEIHHRYAHEANWKAHKTLMENQRIMYFPDAERIIKKEYERRQALGRAPKFSPGRIA